MKNRIMLFLVLVLMSWGISFSQTKGDLAFTARIEYVEKPYQPGIDARLVSGAFDVTDLRFFLVARVETLLVGKPPVGGIIIGLFVNGGKKGTIEIRPGEKMLDRQVWAPGRKILVLVFG